MQLTTEYLLNFISCLGKQLPGMAPFLLTQPERQRQGVTPPSLSDAQGACCVLMVWTDPNLKTLISRDILLPAFCIPLQWQKHSLRGNVNLPSELIETAAQVKTTIASEGVSVDDFHLEPADCILATDFTKLTFSCASAFVPLAASLYLAATGGTPKPNVFSTGSWKGQGIEGVTGIADKVTAVMAASADKPILFVPHANLNEAELAAGDRATITPFRSGGTDLKKCLQPLLAELLAPPAPNASLDEKLDYANNDFIATDRKLRDDYYCNHLVEPLSQRLRPQLHEGCIDPIRRIAAFIGLSRTGTTLLGRVTHGMKRFFLCSEKSKDMLNRCVDLTPDEQGVVLYPGSEAETCEAITRWLKEDEPSAVDITFGTGEMTAILLTAARRSGARVLYLRHDYLDKPNAPKFGTEQYVELDWTLS